MSSRFDPHDPFMVDSNGCLHCDYAPKVKGRFGLAWVSESPDCPYPEPVGWQVEFHDTPSKVEQKCQEMVRWINCPPLPRCDPCPPVELCCSSANKNGNGKNGNNGKCSCSNKKQQNQQQCTCCGSTKPPPAQRQSHKKQQRCACCGATEGGGGGQSTNGRSRGTCNVYPTGGGGTCNNCRFRSPKRSSY